MKKTHNFFNFKPDSIWEVGTAQNIGSRSEQQDHLGYTFGKWKDKPALLAVVADGMGGMSDGARFSHIVVDSHLQFFQHAMDGLDDPENVLPSLAMYANREAHKVYDSDKPGGTTLLSAFFVGNGVFFLSVGDSRIVLFRDGKPLQMNREHTLRVLLDERAWMGNISFEDAEDNMYRNALSSSLGEETIRRVDGIDRPVMLLKNDIFALMSDGIYRSISEKEMGIILKSPIQDAVESVIKQISQKNLPDQDNMSFLAVKKK